jgi:hypothetical protein
VASARGEFVGEVTSCALCGSRQVGMAYVLDKAAVEGSRLAVYPLPRTGKGAPAEKPRDQAAVGDRTVLPEYAEVLPRFRDPGQEPPEGE